MFTPNARSELLDELIERARTDPSVAAAALVGSAARGEVDRWSDIDLALGLAETADVVEVADRWTADLAASGTVAHTLDLWSGPALYRVFLRADSLQVDLSFWPAGTLAGNGIEPIVAVLGEVGTPVPAGPPDPSAITGWGWLYALHARSALARGRPWQARQMLDGLRGQVITLACLRRGVPSHRGRGVDELPDEVLDRLAATLPSGTGTAAIAAALVPALDLLVDEVDLLDATLADRLEEPLAILRATAREIR